MFIKGFKRTHGKFYTFNQTEYSSYGCHDRHGNLIESRVGLGNFIKLDIRKTSDDFFWSVYEYKVGNHSDEKFIAKFKKLNQAAAFILKTYNVGG
jgi:hypothetical protein|tara:strand:- start:8 stop:292 length:285 start_codon:yes stop_codon:yes gene_type:complete